MRVAAGFAIPLSVLTLVGCRTQPTTTSTASERVEWFSDAAEPSGLRFRHVNGMTGNHTMTEILGGGVALFDYDNDGDLDVFLVQSRGRSQLFRNNLIETGTLSFT